MDPETFLDIVILIKDAKMILTSLYQAIKSVCRLVSTHHELQATKHTTKHDKTAAKGRHRKGRA